MNTIKIFCDNTAANLEVAGGTSLLEVAAMLEHELGFKPICALVNNKAEALSYPLFSPKRIEFLPACSAIGRDIYIRSLCMMLYKTVSELYPGLRLRIELSISRGYYCRLIDGSGHSFHIDEDGVERIKEDMLQTVAQDLPFKRKEKPTEEVIEIFR